MSNIIAKWQARQVAIEIDIVLILDFVTEGKKGSASKCVKGLPSGAELIRCVQQQCSFSLIFEHESFDMVHTGSQIPFFELEFEDI